jgi:tetrahydromethanopterin S-methyltransferase subunit C
LFALPEPVTGVAASVVGIVVGAVIGLLQRGRVRGAIGQDIPQAATAKPVQGARTVVALRFADPDNTIKNSRARAILINNEGKIDRSVGRRE